MKYQKQNAFSNKAFAFAFLFLFQNIACTVDLNAGEMKVQLVKPEPYHPETDQTNAAINFKNFRFSQQPGSSGLPPGAPSGQLNIFQQNTEVVESLKPPATVQDREEEVYPVDATSRTYHKYQHRYVPWWYHFNPWYWVNSQNWWYWVEFKACNAISNRWNTDPSGSQLFWRSESGVNDESWEGIFSQNQAQKLDVIEISWINPPKTFQLWFKQDPVGEWLPLSEEYKKFSFASRQGTQNNADSVQPNNAVIFHKPIFVVNVKITMKEPLRNRFFSIRKVKFFHKFSTFVVKNETLDPCQNYCMYVNTDKPRDNSLVEAFPCVEAVYTGNNSELFYYGRFKLLQHLNSNHCVAYKQPDSDEIVLRPCSDNSRAFVLNSRADSFMSYRESPNKCLYYENKKKTSPNFISSDTTIIVTSQADQQTYKKENIKLEGEAYWQSVPGLKRVILQIMFGKINGGNFNGQYETKNVDTIKIDWKKPPKKFMVYTWRPGFSWTLRYNIDDFSGDTTEINLFGGTASAVMIVLEEANGSDPNTSFFAITKVYIGTNSLMVRRGDCNVVKVNQKSLDFDIQSERKLDEQIPHEQSAKNMSMSWEKLIDVYKTLTLMKVFIPKAKEKAESFARKVRQIKKTVGGRTMKSVQQFQVEALDSISNPKFEDQLIINKETFFINSIKGASSPVSINVPGSKTSPATNCKQIKIFKSDAMSGFYYIKPECAPAALRVFCDFTLGDARATDIMIYNNFSDEPNTDLSFLEIKEEKDIRYTCAQLGLYPIQIESSQTVRAIYRILQAMGYDSGTLAVPLGVSYECRDPIKCTSNYGSINDKQSKVINDYFSIKDFGRLQKFYPKFAGFRGLANDDFNKLRAFNINDVKLGALICSTNSHIDNDSDSGLKDLDCSENADGYPMDTPILVKCPEGCKDKMAFRVSGVTKKYTQLSSICKAAIHSEVIPASGGVFKVIRKDTIFSIEDMAEDKHGITIDKFPKNQKMTGFTLEKEELDCPIKQFEQEDEGEEDEDDNDVHSFMELSAKITEMTEHTEEEMKRLEAEMKEQMEKDPNQSMLPPDMRFKGIFGAITSGANKIGKMANKANNAVQSGVSGVANGVQSVSNGIDSAAEKAQNVVQSGIDTANSALNATTQAVNNMKDATQNTFNGIKQRGADFINGLVDAGSNAINNGLNTASNIGNNLLNGMDINFNGQENKGGDSGVHDDDEDDEEKGNTRCEPVTEDGLKRIGEIRKAAEFDYIDIIKKKHNAIKKIFKEYEKLLGFNRKGSKIALSSVSKKFSACLNIKGKAKNFIKSIVDKAVARCTRTAKLANKWTKELQNLKKDIPVNLNFSISINPIEIAKNFMTWTTKTTKKPNWGLFKERLKGRSQAMGDTSGVSASLTAASMHLFKFKNFFDFNLKIDILVKSNKGVCGIAFRIVDSYNYYAVKINMSRKKVSLVKVRNGVELEIRSLNDGAIWVDTWYNVGIITQANTISVTLTNLEATEQRKIETSDTAFTYGSTGVFVNGIEAFYFDKLDVQPLPCWTPWEPLTDIEVIKPNSSIIVEDFTGTLDDKFIYVDSEDDGSCEWVMNAEFAPGKDIGIRQKTMVSSKSGKPCLLIYKNKTMKNGKYTVVVQGDTPNGVISVIFKYKNVKDSTGKDNESFYSFDMYHHDKEPKFQLRKWEDGSPSLLKEIKKPIENVSTLGYLVNRRVQIEVQVLGAQISILVKVGESPLTTVIDVQDNTIESGSVGFGFREAAGIFRFVELFPPKLKLSSSDITHILNSNLNYIPMPDVKAITDAARALDIKDKTKGAFDRLIITINLLSSTLGLDLRRPDDILRGIESNQEWMVCSNAKTEAQRHAYCSNRFNSPASVKSCEGEFCNVCCTRSSNANNPLELYKCNKTCDRSQTAETANDDYKEVCINSTQTNQNIFNYCEEKMQKMDKSLLRHCKLDMCNLCCVTMDKMRSKNYSSGNMMKCFEDCANELNKMQRP